MRNVLRYSYKHITSQTVTRCALLVTTHIHVTRVLLVHTFLYTFEFVPIDCMFGFVAMFRKMRNDARPIDVHIDFERAELFETERDVDRRTIRDIVCTDRFVGIEPLTSDHEVKHPEHVCIALFTLPIFNEIPNICMYHPFYRMMVVKVI